MGNEAASAGDHCGFVSGGVCMDVPLLVSAGSIACPFQGSFGTAQ